jgi:hypothetical protein
VGFLRMVRHGVPVERASDEPKRTRSKKRAAGRKKQRGQGDPAKKARHAARTTGSQINLRRTSVTRKAARTTASRKETANAAEKLGRPPLRSEISQDDSGDATF